MPKFYVNRTFAAEVTEVTEIEAVDMAEAEELVMNGEGEFLGHSVGDAISFVDEKIEVFDAAPHNLPAVFSVPEQRASAVKD